MAETLEEKLSSKEMEIAEENGEENIQDKSKDTEKPQVLILRVVKCCLDISNCCLLINISTKLLLI